MNKDIIEVLVGAMSGLVAYMCGLNWELILIWLMLMTLDLITGVIKGCKNGNFKSSIMKQGLYKKAGEFFLLFALLLGERAAILNGINMPVASIFIGAFCFKELGSIIENSIGMDVKIPQVIAKWFEIANSQISEKNIDKKS